jgi:hypothetical protein
MLQLGPQRTSATENNVNADLISNLQGAAA